MIKEIIAYTLVVYGTPILVGIIIWFVPGTFICKVVGQSGETLDLPINSFAERAIASFVGYFIFSWLGAGPLWTLPILLIIAEITGHNSRNEGYFSIPGVAGIATGFTGLFFYLQY